MTNAKNTPSKAEIDALNLKNARKFRKMVSKVVGEGTGPSGLPTQASQYRKVERKILKKYKELGRKARKSGRQFVRDNYPHSGKKDIQKETNDLKEEFKKGFREGG